MRRYGTGGRWWSLLAVGALAALAPAALAGGKHGVHPAPMPEPKPPKEPEKLTSWEEWTGQYPLNHDCCCIPTPEKGYESPPPWHKCRIREWPGKQPKGRGRQIQNF